MPKGADSGDSASIACYYRGMSIMLVPVWFRWSAREIASLLLFCAIAGACHAQTDAVVCRAGSGSFEAAFPTGVTVQVGAARREGLARRVCEGTLLWDKGRLVVATGVAQLDVDALGIDMGLGPQLVTFQVKRADAECCMTFQVYSLRKPPKLLRTITGGSFFSTADTDLDGQIEIWTDDAAALEGFESPEAGSPELAPTVVLRFVRGRLLDVSSEFQGYFDNEIARARSELDPQELRDFKNSTGRLLPTAHFSAEDLRHSENLERTKIKVLQIIWSYLYSGREQEAWDSLAELWPPADLDRIRAAMVSARARGIRAQVDGVSTKVSSGAQRRTEVFDARTLRTVQPGMKLSEGAAEQRGLGIILPTPILIGRQVSEGQQETLADSGLLLDLVIDSAGKVRSAESDEPSFDSSLKSATARWKFIPALRDGRAVASRIYFIISPKR
jgi:hypothetical protein